MPYHAQHKTFAAADSDDSNDDYDDETVDGDSDDYDYCGSDDYIYDGTIDLNDINYGDDSDDGECVKDYGDNEDIDDADSDDSHTGDHEKDCNEDCVGVDDMDDDDPKDSDEDDCVEDYGDDDDADDGDHYTVSDNEESEPHTNAPDPGVVYEYYDYYDCNIFDREFVCDENEYMYYD